MAHTEEDAIKPPAQLEHDRCRKRADCLPEPLSTRNKGGGATRSISDRYAPHLINIDENPQEIEHGNAEYEQRRGDVYRQ